MKRSRSECAVALAFALVLLLSSATASADARIRAAWPIVILDSGPIIAFAVKSEGLVILDSATGRAARVDGVPGNVHELNACPGGKRFFARSGSHLFEVKLTGLVSKTRRIEIREGNLAVVSSSCKFLALLGSDRGRVSIAELGSSRVRYLDVPSSIQSMCFSGDDRTLVVQRPGGGIWFVDISTGRKTRVQRIASIDLQSIACVGGEVLTTSVPALIVSSKGSVIAVDAVCSIRDYTCAYAANAGMLVTFRASNGTMDSILRMISVKQRSEVLARELIAAPRAVALSADGSRLVALTDLSVVTFELERGKVVKEIHAEYPP